MNIILNLTSWFIKKFPKFGALIAILSILIPIILTVFFDFPETVLLWAVYVEIVIISLSIISVSINFVLGNLILNKKKKNKRRSNSKRPQKNSTYNKLKFTVF